MKHYNQNQFKCTLSDRCTKKAFSELDNLVNHHWWKDCYAFEDIYKLCKNCGEQRINAKAHDCV